jgi:hypothetical protein
MSAFFFLGRGALLGTPSDKSCWGVDCGMEFEVGLCLRELKEEMNSIDWGDSPRRLLKCSAASCLERVVA